MIKINIFAGALLQGALTTLPATKAMRNGPIYGQKCGFRAGGYRSDNPGSAGKSGVRERGTVRPPFPFLMKYTCILFPPSFSA